MFRLKHLLLMCTLCIGGFSAQAQDYINPSVQWKFVISHDAMLGSGNFISYEFPATKNFDYIFTITHNQDSLHGVIMVYDLQDQLLKKMVLDNSQLSIDLNFDVQSSGTYKVIIGLTDPKANKGTPIDSHFTLIRREKV